MNIGSCTFDEFKQKAADFHGYPAPGLLVGAYMVEAAKRALPEGILFEALVETRKCLPDAVQLLTLCSAGNNWMKVVNTGRYALSLYDKHSGEGVRVHLDMAKLAAFPELESWLLKKKKKQDQDTRRLWDEIEEAGDSICTITPVRVHPRFLGHGPFSPIAICPRCGEAFPANDGPVCRGCLGEAPYTVMPQSMLPASGGPEEQQNTPHVVPVEEAVGKKALHDMTEVIPGKSKGAAFSAGQTITAGDVCRLQHMGRFTVAVEADEASSAPPANMVHENAGVEILAKRMAGENIEYSLPPKEGKINFRAAVSGLLTVHRKRLLAFNMTPDVMCATRQDGLLVEAGTDLAGTRIIPLYISREHFAEALSTLEGPLFSVTPLRKAKVGILVTGSEVFQGLIEDKFIPLVSAKVEKLGCTVVKEVIAPDDEKAIAEGIEAIGKAGADLLITTGGMSVDPSDITRAALFKAGLTEAVYGAPVLPGAMTLVGMLAREGEEAQAEGTGAKATAPGMQVIGVPACALYAKTTLFDILLPRLLAGRSITRADMARLGEGGFCMGCKTCTWPKCFFAK